MLEKEPELSELTFTQVLTAKRVILRSMGHSSSKIFSMGHGSFLLVPVKNCFRPLYYPVFGLKFEKCSTDPIQNALNRGQLMHASTR